MSQAVIVAASTLFGVIIAQGITQLRDNTAYKRQEAKGAKEHQRRLNEETANRLRTLYASLLYDIQMWWGLISNMHAAITKLDNLLLQQPPSGSDTQQFVLDQERIAKTIIAIRLEPAAPVELFQKYAAITGRATTYYKNGIRALADIRGDFRLTKAKVDELQEELETLKQSGETESASPRAQEIMEFAQNHVSELRRKHFSNPEEEYRVLSEEFPIWINDLMDAMSAHLAKLETYNV